MTNTIRSDEALSHGHIQDHKAKRAESQDLNKQIEEFLANGGEIEEHPQDNAAAMAELKKKLNL